MPRWKIDPEGLEKAKDLLGVSLPVRFRIVNDENAITSLSGKYHGIGYWGLTSEERLEVPAHHISLGESMTVSSANEIAHHELTHAGQAEDYLPDGPVNGVEPYRVANKGMRMAFGKESRSLRPTGGSFGGKSYYDVSFEKEARFYMKNGDAIDIVVPLTPEEKDAEVEEPEGPTETRDTWRVDMWTEDLDPKKRQFVGTCYVLAKDEWAAKKFARDNHMKGMPFSQNLACYRIYPLNSEAS